MMIGYAAGYIIVEILWCSMQNSRSDEGGADIQNNPLPPPPLPPPPPELEPETIPERVPEVLNHKY